MAITITTNKTLNCIAETYHQSTWKTDNTSTGSSNNNQVKLPLESSGTYNFVVDWGDSSTSTITTYNQAEVTHTYASIGTYTIKIIGTCRGFRFNNGGDRSKILDVQKWGRYFNLGGSTGILYGCTNLTISDTGIIPVTATTASSMFRNCTSLNNSLNVDTSNMTGMLSFLQGCTAFNSSISSFYTSKVTNFLGLFSSSTAFNQSVSNLDTSNATDISYMFYNDSAFNQAVSGFNTAKVTTMAGMFQGCTNFNQDISGWNFTQVTTMTDMLTNATSWSKANYDAFLISAAAQSVKDSVSFKCSAKYTLGGDAAAAKSHLQTTHSWTITDAGGE